MGSGGDGGSVGHCREGDRGRVRIGLACTRWCWVRREVSQQGIRRGRVGGGDGSLARVFGAVASLGGRGQAQSGAVQVGVHVVLLLGDHETRGVRRWGAGRGHWRGDIDLCVRRRVAWRRVDSVGRGGLSGNVVEYRVGLGRGSAGASLPCLRSRRAGRSGIGLLGWAIS